MRTPGHLRGWAVILLLLFLSGCGGTTSFVLNTQKPQDRAELVSGGNTPVVAIFSTSGIGEARIFPPGGKWPGPLRLMLHLRGLEHLGLRCGDKTLDTGLSTQTSQQLPRQEPPGGSPGNPVKVIPSGKIPLENGLIIAEISRDFLGNGDTLQVRWIDFYR